MPTSTGSSNVQLFINVVDVNSGQIIGQVTKNVDLLGTAGAKSGTAMADALSQAGTAGTRAGKQVGDGFKEMGGHALTSLDNVRLLRDDLGIRIPRSMEVAISRSKALSTVISGIGSGLLALGAVELAFHVGREAWELYDKLTDINKEVRKYQEGAAQASAQKLFQANDVETQLANLRQINAEVGKLQRQSADAIKLGITGQVRQSLNSQGGLMNSLDYLGPVGSLVRVGKAGYDTYQGNKERDQNLARDLQDKYDGQDRTFATQQAAQMERLRSSIAARSARVTGAAADRSEEQGRVEVAALTMRQTRDLNQHNMDAYDAHVGDLTQGMRDQHKSTDDINREVAKLGTRPTNDPNAGLEKYWDERLAAEEMGSAKAVARARKENDDIAQLRGQAQAAGLQGEARYRAQLQATIDGFNRRAAEGELSGVAAHRMALLEKQKYDAEYGERLRAEQAETARAQAEAATSGLTGLQRNDAERGARVAELDRQRPTFSDPGTYDARRTAIDQGSAVEATKLQQDFSDRLQQMDDSRANSSMTANQRIAAETRRTVAEITKSWNDLYGGLAENDARRVSGQASLNAEIVRINQNAAEETARNNRQVQDETRKLQLEAGRGGGGNPFAQRRTEIQSQAEDQLRAVQERQDAARNAGELQNVQQFEDQKAAIQQIARNRELDLVREQRDKLAGIFEGFFSNPLEALKRQGEGIASKAAADLLMGRKPGADGSGNGIGAVLGGLNGGGLRDVVRPTFQRNSGMPAGLGAYEPQGEVLPPAPRTADVPVRAQQQVTIEAGSAVINANSASVAGGNVGGGSGEMGSNTAGAPSAAVRGIANGGYVSTGNGGFFNLGGGSGSGEMGSGASAASNNPFADVAGNTASGVGSATYSGTGSTGFGDSITKAYGDVQDGFSQANSLGKDLGLFGKDANGNNAGLVSKIPGLKNMSSEDLGKLGGVAGGALGVFSAFEGKGGVGGAAQGALSGAQAGMEYGGIAGAAIGAVVGGVLGFIGHGARVQAQRYYWRELKPKIDAEMLGFSAGTADYQSVYDDISKSDTEAKHKTREMGSGAVQYYNDTIHPDLQKDLQKLTREQKAGRQQFGMSAAQDGAQHHNGGFINNFGSMATTDGQGWIHAQQGEFVLNQQAAMSHADVASMMNAGTSRADIAEYMGANSPAPQRATGGDEYHFHLSALDTRNLDTWVQSNGHKFRAAINKSYAENSGGAD